MNQIQLFQNEKSQKKNNGILKKKKNQLDRQQTNKSMKIFAESMKIPAKINRKNQWK